MIVGKYQVRKHRIDYGGFEVSSRLAVTVLSIAGRAILTAHGQRKTVDLSA